MIQTSRPYLLATRSSGKLQEIRELLIPSGLSVIDLSEAGIPETDAEEHIESFETFADNALAKAKYFHQLSGLPTLADDSGLSIQPLGGIPGVRSKRWSGRRDLTGVALDMANNATLEAALASFSPEVPIPAEYVCAAVLVDGARTCIRVGRTGGVMLRAPRGQGGFGYDPYFLSDELGKTFGECGRAEKHLISHRGRAFSALLAEMLRPPDGKDLCLGETDDSQAHIR